MKLELTESLLAKNLCPFYLLQSLNQIIINLYLPLTLLCILFL